MTRLFFFLLFFLPGASWGQNLAPEQLVQKITNEVLGAIKSDKALAAGDKQKAVKLAEEKVLPYIDFEEATRLAVGRAWREAKPEQRKQLVTEFRNMLVRTYTNALGEYEGQTLKILPSRKAEAPDEATVRTQFIRKGAPPLPIDFQMLKKDDAWKVYDIAVEGVSLVLTYRSEFDQVVRQSGIEGLVKRLAQKNEPAAMGGGTPQKK